MPHTSADHDVTTALRGARASACRLRLLPGPAKNALLLACGEALTESAEEILRAAREDAALARAHGVPARVVQAVALSRGDLESKARLAGTLAGLPDPVGRVESTWIRPNGLKIEKVRVSLGVAALVVEYDPRAVLDAAFFCIKAGNALAVCAGPMVSRTCRALVGALRRVPLPAQLEAFPVHLVPGHWEPVRRALIRRRQGADVVLAVGSPEWVNGVVTESRVPVLAQTTRRRHVYVDEDSSLDVALRVVADLAAGDPAGEGPVVVLVHRAVAGRVLPAVATMLLEKTASFSADPEAARLLGDVRPPSAASRDEECPVHLTVAETLDAAAAAIAAQGPGYSDAIITDDRAAANRFAALVDSACVCLNASPAFADGGQFGMGGQVTVSTGRLHARGPVAIDELTTCKYVVSGKGQVLRPG